MSDGAESEAPICGWRWGLCAGCDSCCPRATPPRRRRKAADLDAALASLVSEHAPHGFAGFMRSAKDGCQVYVAAAALQDALLRECVTPPGSDAR